MDEHHLMSENPVDAKDVLHGSEEFEVVDSGAEFLVDLPHDRVAVGLAEFDPAADQAVVSERVLCRRWVEADCVDTVVVVRCDEQRLDPDERSVHRHRERVRREQVDVPWC